MVMTENDTVNDNGQWQSHCLSSSCAESIEDAQSVLSRLGRTSR